MRTLAGAWAPERGSLRGRRLETAGAAHGSGGTKSLTCSGFCVTVLRPCRFGGGTAHPGNPKAGCLREQTFDKSVESVVCWKVRFRNWNFPAGKPEPGKVRGGKKKVAPGLDTATGGLLPYTFG